MLSHGLGQRYSHVRAAGLDHERNTAVDDLMHHQKCFLGAVLVVQSDQLELAPTEHAAASVDRIDGELRVLDQEITDIGERTAHRNIQCDLYGLLRTDARGQKQATQDKRKTLTRHHGSPIGERSESSSFRAVSRSCVSNPSVNQP